MLKSRSMPAVWIVLIWCLVMIFPGGCAKKAVVKEEAVVTQEQKPAATAPPVAAPAPKDDATARERALLEQALREQVEKEAAEKERTMREQTMWGWMKKGTKGLKADGYWKSEAAPAGKVTASADPAGPQVSPEFATDTALLARREAYLKQLKKGSYTFNPPSPIKVATTVTVYFWLDPLVEPMRLAEELKTQLLKMRPGKMPQTEAGRMDWSPMMRATLTATSEDFDITPTERKDFDGRKNISSTRRTEWSWDVKAKHIGQELPLHLRVWAVLPQELGEPDEILKLDKLIHVDVTIFYLVDKYWEKYWKWILGGLGTALAGAISAWWNIRRRKVAGG